MKLCIPTTDGRGLAAAVASHFGSAPYFTLIDSETGRAEVVANDHEHEHQHLHGSGACHSADALRSLGIEAILCRGLGRRAFARFAGEGVAVFVIEDADAGRAVDSFRAGRATLLTARDACGGGRRHGREGCREGC